MSSTKRPPAGQARLNYTTIRFEPPETLQLKLDDQLEFPAQDRHDRWFWFELPGKVVEVCDEWVELQVVLPWPTQGLAWEVLDDLCQLTPEKTNFRLCGVALLHPNTQQRVIHPDLLSLYQQLLKGESA